MAKPKFAATLSSTLLLSFVLVGGCSGCSNMTAPKAPEAPKGFTFAKDDDPELAKAKAEAQSRWKEFAEAFAVRRKDEKFAINSCLYDNDNKRSEYKWIAVDRIYETQVVGHLEHDSAILPNIKAGMAVTVNLPDIADWAWVDSSGTQHGGFSLPILKKRAGQ